MVKHPAWSRFGAEVRRLRVQSGYSQAQLARAIPLSQSMLSGIELGRKGAKRDHAEALDRVLNTGGRLVRLWDSLNSIPAHPSWFQNVLALERKAVEIREYQMVVLPGLLQTEDYARSLIRPAQPWANAEKVDELVHARMSRREILTAPDRPLCWFVVDQVVIDRVTGSPTVMKEQLTYLLNLIEDHTIRFQVFPQEIPLHPGLTGLIRIMSFDDRPTMAYVEHTLGGLLTDQQQEVRYCSAIFSALQSEALSSHASADYIRRRKDQL